MKRIFAITQVRNESDIIESFCRYNLTYCDGMMVYENYSLDNTRDIIQSLINEGLPIYFTDDIRNLKLHFLKIKAAMAKKAIDEYGADLIVPLDGDEFLYHTEGHNPRDVLEELCEDIEYQIPWRTYVYQREPEGGQEFLPNFFTSYRNPRLETLCKVIASKYLIQQKQADFTNGCHSLEYPDEHKWSVAVKRSPNLVYAHFPLRSKPQVMTKIVPGWIGNLTIPIPQRKNWAFQWKLLFDEIKNNGDISAKKIRQHSIEYSVPEQRLKRILPKIGDCLTIEGPMDVAFCADKLFLRYTKYKNAHKTFLRTTLRAIESSLTVMPEREEKTVKMLYEAQNIIDSYNSIQRKIAIVLLYVNKIRKTVKKKLRFFIDK